MQNPTPHTSIHFWQSWAFWSMFGVILLKIPFFFTRHIQEDAFITWRVAQNLLDYGVIGFNGETKISASTTHLYVFVSWLFNALFGKENFIYPLLMFNTILFSIGSLWLGRMLGLAGKNLGIFIVLFGLLPPSIKIGILGMEYGILFFLEMGFLYFALHKNKDWAKYIFPMLIMFTRIDTVIFLGVAFLVHWVMSKRFDVKICIGGLIGLVFCLGFNQLYFYEWVNNTLVAKKIAYQTQETFNEKLQNWWYNLPHFWSMLKLPGQNPFFWLVFVFEITAFVLLMKKLKGQAKEMLIIVFAFSLVKSIVFLTQKSYFDWYYWVPQILMFVPVLLLVLLQTKRKLLWLSAISAFYIFPMIAFQAVHSIATGNGEWNYRRGIGLFLGQYEKDKNQWIFLEPAGYVPYFSGLKTIDEVGLVDKGVQQEIIHHGNDFRYYTVKNRKPKYVLSYTDLFDDKHADYYKSHYRLIKEFRIEKSLSSPYPILEKIYRLKPSGTDYNLYERTNTQP